MPERLRIARANPRGSLPAGFMRTVSGHTCQAADLGILSAAFLGAVALPVFHPDRASLDAVLQFRISVRGLIVGAMCIGTWYAVLRSVGIYSPSRVRSLSSYLYRWIIGLNSCTAAVGLVEIVMNRGVDAWQVVEVYWCICLVLMTLLRLGLMYFSRKQGPMRWLL
jgi:hypothetical protein